MSTKCSNVITIQQYGPTCWFNSILMAVLYSQESRKLLLEKSKTWNKKIKILKTLEYILKHKYLRTDNISKDYLYFNKVRPENILENLHEYNNKKFYNTELFKSGFFSSLYIRKFYKLLGAKVLFLDYTEAFNSDLYYSRHNNISMTGVGIEYVERSKPLTTILKHFEDPDVIIIKKIRKDDIANYYPYPLHYGLENLSDKYMDDKTYKSLLSLGKKVTYKNETYTQDSVLLTNWNDYIIRKGHSIAGITCEGERYVYNGWTRTTIDPNIAEELEHNNKEINIPCELMKFDWDIKNPSEFCLNRKKCILDSMNINYHNLCFSFNKGSREIIYIKDSKDKSSSSIKEKSASVKEISTKPSKPAKICPEGKAINPLTGRCVFLKNLNKLPKKPKLQINNDVKPAKPVKVCPEGKVINPLTDRCINIKTANKKLKNESDKPDKPAKPVKVCPEGKVINPLTGRCIKIKVKK
jgi:hypothetical protein